MRDYDDEFYGVHDEPSLICPVTIDDWKHGKDHFQGVLECLYGYKSLKDLECHLEEVCYMFNINLPEPKRKLPTDE